MPIQSSSGHPNSQHSHLQELDASLGPLDPSLSKHNSYLDLPSAASSPASVSRSTSTARLRIATSEALVSSKSASHLPASHERVTLDSQNPRSHAHKKKRPRGWSSNEEVAPYLQRVGSSIGLDMRDGTEAGNTWLEHGSRSSADLRAYTRDPSALESPSLEIPLYRPDPKPVSSRPGSRPVSRGASRVNSRPDTRHHSRRSTAPASPLEERHGQGMFTLSRPLTRSSDASGKSTGGRSEDEWRNMVPDFVDPKDKEFFERLYGKRHDEHGGEAEVESEDPEDDDEIRRIREKRGHSGLGKIVDRMVGVTLFDPDDDDFDDDEELTGPGIEAAKREQVKGKKVEPLRTGEGSWLNPASILSFATNLLSP